MPQSDSRLEVLTRWLQSNLSDEIKSIHPASSDASFRRYFRVEVDGISYVAMDAQSPKENLRSFLAVADLLNRSGVQVPTIFSADLDQGFLLLSDFGTRRYLDVLNPETADRLYGDALDALQRLQQTIAIENTELPPYHESLLRTELGIFHEWFLQKYLKLELTTTETALLDEVGILLVDSALEQPQIFVHRDYHSRNLMVTEHFNPGILDFQDAVIGPLTYDLVSLLRDCYISWPKSRIDTWVAAYRLRLYEAGMIGAYESEQFRRWFDLMGMQRHLKAIGIFSRLKLRDDKPGYVKDIPRTLDYVLDISRTYPQFSSFARFLEERVLPKIILGNAKIQTVPQRDHHSFRLPPRTGLDFGVSGASALSED